MEAPRSAPQSESAAWQLVRTNPRLRGEPKLAWRFIWGLAGGKPGTTVVTSAIDVGADQGRGKQCGHRALAALIEEGLIERIDVRDSRWWVYVVDPAELQTARRRTFDNQRHIPEIERDHDRDDEAAGSGCCAHPDPLPSKEGDISTSTLPSEPSRLRTFVPSEPSVPSERGTPQSIASSLAGYSPDQHAARLQRQVAEIAADIRSWVNDDRLRTTPILRVARAVADGQLSRDAYEDFKRWFITARRNGKITEPWQAFTGVAKVIFARNHLAWPTAANDGGR